MLGFQMLKFERLTLGAELLHSLEYLVFRDDVLDVVCPHQIHFFLQFFEGICWTSLFCVLRHLFI